MTQEALKLAFNEWWDTQPPRNETNPCMTDSFEYWAWEGWHAALAQPEQEPLAWIERDIQCDDFDPDSVTCEKPTIATDGWEWIGLYTTPPQRTQPNDIDLFWRAVTTPEKWVGLTAEEVLQCWEKAHEPGNKEHINAIRMADEVEQALKEKNCG